MSAAQLSGDVASEGADLDGENLSNLYARPGQCAKQEMQAR